MTKAEFIESLKNEGKLDLLIKFGLTSPDVPFHLEVFKLVEKSIDSGTPHLQSYMEVSESKKRKVSERTVQRYYIDLKRTG